MPRPLGHVLSELFFNVTEAHQIKEAKYSSLGYARQYGGGGGGVGGDESNQKNSKIVNSRIIYILTQVSMSAAMYPMECIVLHQRFSVSKYIRIVVESTLCI